MLQQVQARLRRFRTRLMMRSALTNGWLFRRMRGEVGERFNQRAEGWDQMVGEHEYKWFDPLDAALDQLGEEWAPRQVVDIGGGTGRAGYHLARRYPDACVVVLDVAQKMLDFGRSRQTRETLPPVAFVAGDSAALPLRSGNTDLAFVLNAPPNPAEMARVLRPGGVVVLAFTYGRHTPMYLDEETSRKALGGAGFQHIRAGTAGEGSWVMALKPET